MAKAKANIIRALRVIGFRRNSEYVSDYLNTTNIRMSIWMCLVIAGIEIWMIIRQTSTYYFPRIASGKIAAGFPSFWGLTGNFWLLLSISFSILGFAMGRLYFRNQKARFVLNLVLGLVSLAASLMVIYSSSIGTFASWEGPKALYTNVFTILCYVLGAIYSVGVLAYTFLAYYKKLEIRILAQIIIALFGFICLAFGVMVSFSDFIGYYKDTTTLQYKQIICFLTMVVYMGCLLAYRPIVSIALLGAVFYGFYRLLLSVDYIRVFPDGDRVNYLTFVLMLVVVVSATYSQRYNDAVKSEELEFKAKYDTVTGLYNFDHFVSLVAQRIADPAYSHKGMYLFTDVEDFKSYNDRRGFNRGNELIHGIGERLAEAFGRENCAHVFADRFVIFTEEADYLDRIDKVRAAIVAFDPEANAKLKFGGCPSAENDDIRRCFDRARYAEGLTKRAHDKNYIEYDEKLDEGYRLMRHIIHTLDEAIEKGYIRPYYQPVVWSEDGTLCGTEALCRWIDPKYGFISPGVFIPILENTRLIDKVDACIVESVCRDIRKGLDENLPVVPVSINLSRLDFELMDPVALLEETVRKYGVPKNYVHVEITESALAGDLGSLSHGINTLRELGYAIWLDDFGSGYSTFNVLKEFHFDVLKIDMQFLSNFATNKNARVLIEVIVNMCDRIGMKTLTEGVETKEEVDFLKSIGCGRLQGYLFGKAMPAEELTTKINDGTYKMAEKYE